MKLTLEYKFYVFQNRVGISICWKYKKDNSSGSWNPEISIPKFLYYQISKIVITEILIDLQDFLKTQIFFTNNLRAKGMFRILLEFSGILKPENSGDKIDFQFDYATGKFLFVNLNWKI